MICPLVKSQILKWSFYWWRFLFPLGLLLTYAVNTWQLSAQCLLISSFWMNLFDFTVLVSGLHENYSVLKMFKVDHKCHYVCCHGARLRFKFPLNMRWPWMRWYTFIHHTWVRVLVPAPSAAPLPFVLSPFPLLLSCFDWLSNGCLSCCL